MDERDKLARRLSNPDLRCKNRCGFYGNPIYLGYCSKCYKELVRDANQDESEGQRSTPLGPIPEQSTSASPGLGDRLAFLRFNAKKKLQSTAKSHGRFFRGGSPLKPSPNAVSPTVPDSSKGGKKTSTQSLRQLLAEAKKPGTSTRVVEPFNEFLKTLKKPAAQDIVHHLKSFRKYIAEKTTATVEEQGEAIQDFYINMSEHLQTHSLFRNMSEEQQESMMDGIEKHLMTNIYHDVYSPASCDDEMKDLLLLRRIRMLHWLEPHHLEIPLKLDHPEVQDMISKARQELWSMDSKKAPQDKLSCVSKCCTHLLSALRVSQDGPASADEFLPSFIFMIIYTSPQHVHSNINYISRFSNPSRLMCGEAGYYFTHLCGAVSFIENVTAENLRMSGEEFNDKMGYVGGKTDMDLLLEEGLEDIDEDTENKQVLQSCSDGISELTSRLTQVMADCHQLQAQMAEFNTGLREQVDSILKLDHTHLPSQTVASGVCVDLIDLSDQGTG